LQALRPPAFCQWKEISLDEPHSVRQLPITAYEASNVSTHKPPVVYGSYCDKCRILIVSRMSVAFTDNEDCSVASEAALAGFEHERNVVLPPDYRKFLLSSRGGCPERRWSSFGERDGDFVAHVYGLHQGAEWKRLSYAIKEFGHDLSTYLPVAISNGGNYFLLRLKEPNYGAVCFWDHELEGCAPPTFESLIHVSDSFSLWLDSLQEDP
jgi:hypothetical protein